MNYLKDNMRQKKGDVHIYESFGEVRPIFREFVENYQLQNKELPNLIDAIFNIYVKCGWSNEDELSLKEADKENWKKLLFDEISRDSRFESLNSSYIVKKILDDQKDHETSQKIRQLITEIYKEKAEKEPFYKKYMEYLISRLDN